MREACIINSIFIFIHFVPPPARSLSLLCVLYIEICSLFACKLFVFLAVFLYYYYFAWLSCSFTVSHGRESCLCNEYIDLNPQVDEKDYLQCNIRGEKAPSTFERGKKFGIHNAKAERRRQKIPRFGNIKLPNKHAYICTQTCALTCKPRRRAQKATKASHRREKENESGGKASKFFFPTHTLTHEIRTIKFSCSTHRIAVSDVHTVRGVLHSANVRQALPSAVEAINAIGRENERIKMRKLFLLQTKEKYVGKDKLFSTCSCLCPSALNRNRYPYCSALSVGRSARFLTVGYSRRSARQWLVSDRSALCARIPFGQRRILSFFPFWLFRIAPII